MKGVSIPINTLVMLAVAIIVLLAAVAWFMGAFSPTAQEQSLKQRFDATCLSWSMSNCGKCKPTDGIGCEGHVPDPTCKAWVIMLGHESTPGNMHTYCDGSDRNGNYKKIAHACGCVSPLGTELP